MEHMANQITLRGSLSSLPEFSHENHGKRFFRFFLVVPRLSGAVDTLPVIAEEAVLDTLDLSAGEMLTITGQDQMGTVHRPGAEETSDDGVCHIANADKRDLSHGYASILGKK